jgi:hypothetical protein
MSTSLFPTNGERLMAQNQAFTKNSLVLTPKTETFLSEMPPEVNPEARHAISRSR